MQTDKKDILTLCKWLLKRFGYLKKEFRGVIDKAIYQPQSRFLLHKWHGHKCPFEAILFYNYTGRILFGTKEFLALLTGGKIIKKTIRLEGFEKVDFKQMYDKGSDTLLWPKSPFVQYHEPEIPDSFFTRLTDSFHLANQPVPNGLDIQKTSWWEKVSKNIREWIIDDSGQIRKNELINFRKESRFEQFITDQFTYVDTKNSYFSEYLKAIDVVLEYHRFAQHIPKEILASISESRAGNNACIVYRGKRLSEKSLFYATAVSDITTHVALSNMQKTVICDLGTGYGGLPAMLRYYMNESCQILIDFPEVLIFAAYYIRYNFPDAKIALLEDLQKDDFKSLLENYDFILIPPEYMTYIPDETIDLLTNTASLGFLDRETSSLYLSEISRILKKEGYFYSVNQAYTGQLGTGMYEWDFHEEYLTILLSFSNRFAYPQWLGKKC